MEGEDNALHNVVSEPRHPALSAVDCYNIGESGFQSSHNDNQKCKTLHIYSYICRVLEQNLCLDTKQLVDMLRTMVRTMNCLVTTAYMVPTVRCVMAESEMLQERTDFPTQTLSNL